MATPMITTDEVLDFIKKTGARKGTGTVTAEFNVAGSRLAKSQRWQGVPQWFAPRPIVTPHATVAVGMKATPTLEVVARVTRYSDGSVDVETPVGALLEAVERFNRLNTASPVAVSGPGGVWGASNLAKEVLDRKSRQHLGHAGGTIRLGLCPGGYVMPKRMETGE